jgi:hypothetical protein
MGDSPNTVNSFESRLSELRRELLAEMGLPDHVTKVIAERGEMVNEHMPELLAFARLRATKNEVEATVALRAEVGRQAQIGKDQADTGKRLVGLTRALVNLTLALVIVGVSTLVASTVTLLYLSGHL